jgi:cardiolipin synthase A/B
VTSSKHSTPERSRLAAHNPSALGARSSSLVEGPRPSFSRALWRIAAADVSCGNRLTLMRSGAKIFTAMLELIDGAESSVDFEQYIFRNDEVGQAFAEAFTRAVKRGVKVRVLIDWVGRLPTRGSFFRRMRRQGVDVRLFNPPGFRRWFGLLPRDHRKLMVVDGKVGVTGGVGIGVEWKKGMLRRRRSPWRDTVVRIEGDAVHDMHQAFESMWERASSGRATGRPPRALRRILRPPRASHLNARYNPPALVGIIEGEPGKLRVSRALQMQAVAAERSIWIASAYFAPGESEIEALAGAARDGVDVRVLVPRRWDHFWLRSLMTRSYHILLRNGVRIWEWRGEMMHAKTSVVDGRWVRIGSTDFNPLGVAFNYELDAVIEDPTLGREAEEMFLNDLSQSRELRLRRDGIVGPRDSVTGEVRPVTASEIAAEAVSRATQEPDRLEQ